MVSSEADGISLFSTGKFGNVVFWIKSFHRFMNKIVVQSALERNSALETDSSGLFSMLSFSLLMLRKERLL